MTKVKFGHNMVIIVVLMIDPSQRGEPSVTNCQGIKGKQQDDGS